MTGYRLNHLLVIVKKFFGHLRREEIKIAFADGFGFGFAAEVFQVGRIGHGFPAGGVLGIDGIRQVVNQRAQQEAFF